MEAALGILDQLLKQEKSQFAAEIYAFGAEKFALCSKNALEQ